MAIVFLEANSTGTTSDAIKLATRRGCRTVFVTMQREFYETLPDNPLDLCDTVVTCDTYNVAEILRALREEDVEAIISFDDYHLVTAALCAMALGLPHADVPGLVAARYKDVARELTRNLPGGIWTLTVPEEELGTVDLDSLPYPVIVKPVDESGSVSVQLCRTPADVVSVTERYRSHVVNVREYKPVRALLFEEFIDGDEYSCELYWKSGRGWRVAGLTRKFLGAPPSFVERGHVFPAPLPEQQAKEVGEQVVGWVEATGLRCGAAHVELRINDSGPHLIEINPRLPGGHITQLVAWCTGIDMVAHYLDFHLRTTEPQPRSAPEFAAASSRFVLPDEVAAGKTHEDVYESFTRLPTFRRGRVQPAALSSDRTAQTNYDRIGYVLLAGDDPAALGADLDVLAQDLCS